MPGYSPSRTEKYERPRPWLPPGFRDRLPHLRGLCPPSYLVHSLPHEVLLHGDIETNELLHGAAKQAVIEELVQALLVL